MDALNYMLFKNPVITYSWSAVKYAATNASGIVTKSGSSTSIQNASISKDQLLDMLSLHRNHLRIAGFFGASAVALGAYGAHHLLTKDGKEYTHRKDVFRTASQYHFYHTLAFAVIPFCRFPKLSAFTMASGIIIFCGSCYYQSLTGDDTPRKITPYGGSLLILAWLTMIL